MADDVAGVVVDVAAADDDESSPAALPGSTEQLELQLDMIGQLVAIDGQLLLLGLEEIQILEIIQHLMGGLVFL